jgi:hypothetical protein
MRLLAVRIRAADAGLRRELRQNMKAAAAPVVARVQQSILDMPSKHGGDLRREVAKTVTSRVSLAKTGVQLTILSSGSKMPAGKTNLPAEMDRATGWGHPVFERKSRRRQRKHWTWVRQRGKVGWFENAVAGEARQLRQAVQDAMDTTARKAGG